MNERYNRIKAEHPDWSEEQIWTAVSVEMNSANVINEAGPNIDPNNPDIIKSVLEGAKIWLKEVLPNIFVKVASFFDSLILNVGEWCQKGLSYIVKAIEVLYDKGKNILSDVIIN